MSKTKDQKMWKLYSDILSLEDIRVEFNPNVQTAQYVFSTKTILVPIFSYLTRDMYQLLVSHEIGHVLSTKYDKKDLDRYMIKYKGIFNTIEDAYIEKAIKKKYNGLSEIFQNGYKDLYSNNFFNLDSVNVDDLNFVERLNLYAKLRHIIKIPFSKEEMKFIPSLLSLNSNDDVIKLCDEIYKFIKDRRERLFPSKNSLQEGDTSTEENDEGISLSSSENTPRNDSDDENNHTENYGTQNEASNDSFEDELNDNIQKGFEKNLAQCVNQNRYVPKSDDYATIDSSKFVLENDFSSKAEMGRVLFDNTDLVDSGNTLTQENKEELVNAVKEYAKYATMIFLQRKSAHNLNMTTKRNVGLLNMKKIQNHRISENIFRQIRNTPNSENHGIVILLDFSGSMVGKIKHVIFQAAVLAEFCKMNNIIFEIIAFGMATKFDYSENYSRCVKICDSLHYNLKHLLYFGYAKSFNKVSFDYYNTPTMEGLVFASNSIKKMKDNGIEKVSLTVITDGDHDKTCLCTREYIECVKQIIYDNMFLNIKDIIDDSAVYKDWIIELILYRIKLLYDCTVSFINIANFDAVVKRLPKSIINDIGINMNEIQCDELDLHLNFDIEWQYLIKHWKFFEDESLKVNKKNPVISHRFKNNPFIDFCQYINPHVYNMINYKIGNLNATNLDSELTSFFVNGKHLRLFVENYIKEIS